MEEIEILDSSNLFQSLQNLNSMNRKQKLALLNAPTIKRFLKILKLDEYVQYLFEQQQIECKKIVSYDDIEEQFRKIFLRMEYGQISAGNNFKSIKYQQQNLYLIFQGQISVQYQNLQLNQYDHNNYLLNNILSNKNKQKISILKIQQINQKNYQKIIINSKQPKLLQINQYKILIINKKLIYLKFLKKLYQDLQNYLKIKQMEININFISKYLNIDQYQVKIYKLYKIPIEKYNKFNYIVFSDFNGIILIRKGQLKIIAKNKNNNQKLNQIILTVGSLINKYSKWEKQRDYNIVSAIVQKDCSLIYIPQYTIQKLFEELPIFKQTFLQKIRIIQQSRTQYLKIRAQSPIKQKQNKYYPLELPFEGYTVKFKGLNTIHDRFSSRNSSRILKNQSQFSLTLHKQDLHIQQQKYDKFISNYPYQKLIQSKQIIFNNQYLQNCKSIKKCDKIRNYLKKNQIKKKVYADKVLKLRMKNLAQKQINIDHNKLNRAIRNTIIQKGLFQEDIQYNNKLQIQKNQNNINNGINLRQSQQTVSTNPKCQELQTKQVGYLANNDLGIISQFLKHKHTYQKQIKEVLRKSIQQQQNINQQKKQKKSMNHSCTLSQFAIKKQKKDKIQFQKNKQNQINFTQSVFKLDKHVLRSERSFFQSTALNLDQCLSKYVSKKILHRGARGKVTKINFSLSKVQSQQITKRSSIVF